MIQGVFAGVHLWRATAQKRGSLAILTRQNIYRNTSNLQGLYHIGTRKETPFIACWDLYESRVHGEYEDAKNRKAFT